MAEQSEWDAAYRDVIAKGRERVGDPPTAETLVAYSRGELSESEAERVRESLAYYPELAAALAEDNEQASDAPPYLSESQLAADWQSLQRRLKRPAGPLATSQAGRKTPPLWQWATAASFLLVALFGGLYLKSVATIRALRHELQRPHANVERIELYDDSSRGGSRSGTAVRLRPSTDHLLLSLALAVSTSTENFRVDILDMRAPAPRVIWSSPIRRGQDGTFVIDVPLAFLPRDAYRLNLFEDDQRDPTATYSLRFAGK